VAAIKKENTEVSVACILSEDDSDDWYEACPNNAVKSLRNEAFTEKYKMEPPFPDQKKQFVVTVKKMISKGGVDLPEKFRPRVFQMVAGEKVDITFEKLVANGSRGKLAYSTYSAPTPEGTKVTAQLVAILVEDLIEYVPEGDGGDGTTSETPENVFGDGKLSDAPKNQKAVVKQTDAHAKEFAKEVDKVVKKAKVVENDSTDLSPF
jgi:hypothetical protein